MFLALIKIATEVNLLVVFRAQHSLNRSVVQRGMKKIRNGNKQYFELLYSMRSVHGRVINSVREMEISSMC